MKKKLIAIVASLAMVATMVPATAFGAAKTSTFTLDELSSAKVGEMDGKAAGTLGHDYAVLHKAGNMDNIVMTTSGNSVTLTGVVPYGNCEGYSTTKSLQAGNYIGLGLTYKAEAAPTGAKWYLKEDGMWHTGKDKIMQGTTDLTELESADTNKEYALIKHMEGKVYTFELYKIATADQKFGESDTALKASNWFGGSWDDDNKPDGTRAYGSTQDLKALLAKDSVKADKETFTVDTRSLTLINKEDTEALNEFVETVALIGGSEITDVSESNTVNAAYKRAIRVAQAAYDALTAEQKDIIEKTVSQEKNANYKKAYEALELAKKNVAGEDALQELIKDIIALPLLPKTAFADQAAIEAAYAPMAAAEKVYNTLTDAQQAKVDTDTNPNTLEKYRSNYDRLIKLYVDPLYAKAAKIDVTQPLTAEDRALIAELKTYVEGEYIATTGANGIDDFDQATYDALIAALDKVVKDEASLENATIAAIADQAYTGAAIEPAVTVTDQAGKEVSADDYTVIYSNNKDAGTATVTVAAKSSSAYTGSVSATFTITPAALTDAMVKSVANATYTGNAVTPAVTVEKGVTYDVTYSNNTAVGKATATITGTGNYTGTITKNFIVKPAKEAISSLKAGKKSLTVAYKAQTGAKYRIVYSPAKGQAKAVNTTATKKTIKSLKAGKTYKVKVRAYKVVDGKTYNGTYSTVKKVKVK